MSSFYDKLFTSRDSLVKAVMSLYSRVSGVETKVNNPSLKVMDNGDVYVYGVGGYDGTNAGEAGVDTLQKVLEDLAG